MTSHTLKIRTTGLLIVSVLSFAAMPALAGAQFNTGPTSDQYDPGTIIFEGSAEGGAEGGDPSAGVVDPSAGGLNDPVGPLPFTGFDVIAMLAVALAVAGLGLALQRAVSREPRDLR